jgi:hypothetical protein
MRDAWGQSYSRVSVPQTHPAVAAAAAVAGRSRVHPNMICVFTRGCCRLMNLSLHHVCLVSVRDMLRVTHLCILTGATVCCKKRSVGAVY